MIELHKRPGATTRERERGPTEKRGNGVARQARRDLPAAAGDWLTVADIVVAAGLAVAAVLSRTLWLGCLAGLWAVLAWRQGRLAARRRRVGGRGHH